MDACNMFTIRNAFHLFMINIRNVLSREHQLNYDHKCLEKVNKYIRTVNIRIITTISELSEEEITALHKYSYDK